GEAEELEAEGGGLRPGRPDEVPRPAEGGGLVEDARVERVVGRQGAPNEEGQGEEEEPEELARLLRREGRLLRPLLGRGDGQGHCLLGSSACRFGGVRGHVGWVQVLDERSVPK